MPYLYSHTQFGLTVRDRLAAPLSTLLHEQQATFFLGLLGPDVYFFDRLPPPLFRKHEKRTGNALHDAPMDAVFSALLPLCAPSPALHAYALGFLCHAALDSAVHPYVCSQYQGNDHTRYEMALDLPLCGRLRLQSGVDLSKTSPARLFAASAAGGIIDPIDLVQQRLAGAVCGRGGRGVYKRSFRNFRFIHRLLYDPSGRKRRFLTGFERLFRMNPGVLSGFLLTPARAEDGDLFNEEHRPWAAPWQAEAIRTESFFDLYETALAEAVRLLPLCAKALSGGDRAPLLAHLKEGSMAHGTPV